MTELITAVLTRYHPAWEPPKDDGRKWIPTRCPFHDEENPSATVSYRVNAFNCFACGVKGDAIGLIRRMEGGSYQHAVTIAQGMAEQCGEPLRVEPARQPGRKTFGDTGISGGSGPVQIGLRRKPFTGA